MGAHEHFSEAFTAKVSGYHRIDPPADGGTINLTNLDRGLIEYDTNSAMAAKVPPTDILGPATSFLVSNIGTGTITIKTQAGATIDTVANGEIKEFVISSNGTWKASGGLTTAQAELLASLNTSATGTGRIGVPLTSITQENGAVLAAQSSTTSGWSQLANKNTVLNIPVNATNEAFAASVPAPSDLNAATADSEIVLNVVVSKSANNDALTLDAELYAVMVDEAPPAVYSVSSDGYSGSAVAIPDENINVLQFAPDADWIAGAATAALALAFVLTLGGTNDGDAVYIHAVYWTYRKKLLTS